MKVAIYIRVSSDEQYTKGVSIKDQQERGIEFCKENNYEYEVFEELAVSATKPIEERPKLFELLKRTQKQKQKNGSIVKPEFEGLYIVDFDRVSRDEIQFPVIKHHFAENEIIIFDKGQTIDLNDSHTSLLVSIKGSLASYEIAKLKERIKRSLERSVMDGKAGGGPVLNYGYAKGKDKKLIVDEEESKIVCEIYDMAIKGMGSKRIAKELNDRKIKTKRAKNESGKLKIRGVLTSEFVWRDSTIYRILTNSIYCGERNFSGKVYSCPSIVSTEKFKLVQEILKERKHYVNTTNKYDYLLKGLILCPTCKNLFYGRKREDLSDNQYICASQRNSEFCGNRGINIDKIEKIIWNSILELPDKIQSLVIDKNGEYVDAVKDEIKKSNKKIESLNIEFDNLMGQVKRNPNLSLNIQKYLDETNEKLRLETQNVQDKERQLELSTQHQSLVDTLRKQINPLKKKKISFEEKQRIVRSLISFIIVKWSEQRGEHLIWTFFRITELSDLKIQGLSKISYEKSGFLYREKQIAYEFRMGNLKTEIDESENGKKRYVFNDGKDEYFTIEDFIEDEYENFKELIWKARKRKNMN